MIVNVIEIFTEYLSVIFCVHRIAKKKITLDKYVWMFFLLDLFSILLAHKYREEHGWLMMVTYINFFVYVKMRINKKWAEALKVFCIMLIMIPSLQMIIYFSIKFILDLFSMEQAKGIFVNCIICILIKGWKKNHLFHVVRKLIKPSGVTVAFAFCSILTYFLYLYKKSEYVYNSVTVQTLAGVIGVGVITSLWVNSENEKKNKARELQLYELYNKTFEEAITAIRARQHEFDNHINAIKCLQFTIDNQKDLAKAQNEYCDKVLNQNSLNKLLKLQTEPIITGFLYSKFMNAKEQGINVIHEVHSIKFQNIIEINELIEILGILFDNAIEALKNENIIDRTLLVKMIQEDKEKISIEVSNKSRKYANNEIEKFCIYGYSTKGEKRGVGLSRVKDIVKKYKADFYIGNVNYNGDNYLCFKIYFRIDKRN